MPLCRGLRETYGGNIQTSGDTSPISGRDHRRRDTSVTLGGESQTPGGAKPTSVCQGQMRRGTGETHGGVKPNLWGRQAHS